ncbi:ABC transporter ATP-binding protein [Roseixanthobacter glucoisosaccharinicivorans]|uniref:ABC transporter ATP-binding protein n=1 Tax=Roseixanthobacter glucoisosaccharinicivorans TaxID=3119923 RepID=UPI00372BB4E0
MSPPLLEAEGLAKSYGGVAAVRGVSFSLAAGEILALIGPNGAGKSTCFGLLGGQVKPDAGMVRLAGQDITGAPPRRLFGLGVGRTFQIAATFASMSVRENVAVALLSHHRALARPFGHAARRHDKDSDTLLELVGLADQAGRASGELAYGDIKRLELALALANAPRLLLMDEPTAGMASGERIALMRLVARLARERNMGILFTEHDMDVVFEHADRVLVLDRGALIAQGPPAAIRTDERVRAVYLGTGSTFAGDADA